MTTRVAFPLIRVNIHNNKRKKSLRTVLCDWGDSYPRMEAIPSCGMKQNTTFCHRKWSHIIRIESDLCELCFALQYHPEVAKGSGESLDWNEMKSFIIQVCGTGPPRWCPSSTKVKATWEVSQRAANILSLFLVILPTRATRLFNFGCTTCPIHLVAPCDAVLMFAEDRRTMFTPGEDEKRRMFLWAGRWRIYIFSYGWWDRASEGCVGLTFSPT